MKKVFTLVLSIMLIAALSACAGTPDTAVPAEAEAPVIQEDIPPPELEPPVIGEPDEPEPEPEVERANVVFAAQGDATEGTRALLDAFNESQDLYTVVWEEMTNDSGVMREQLITSLQAGSSEYDVVSLDVVWAGEFAAAGFIEPIDTYMRDAGLTLAQFNAGSMASGRYGAMQYVLPFFPDVGFLYFRSDIVSEENAARLVAGDYTFADLLEMAETYQGQGGTVDGYVFQANLYEGLTCNVNEFTFNWQDIRGGLEIMKAFVDSNATPADILSYTEGETHNSFINGQSVFARNWPYQWGMILSEGEIGTDQVNVAPLPGGGTVGGWLMAMNSNSQNKDGAWALMEFIATHEGQRIFSTVGGYLPGFNATLEDPEVIANNELLTKPGFQMALTTSIARPISSEYARVSDEIQHAVHSFLAGDAELDETVAAIEAALEGA